MLKLRIFEIMFSRPIYTYNMFYARENYTDTLYRTGVAECKIINIGYHKHIIYIVYLLDRGSDFFG